MDENRVGGQPKLAFAAKAYIALTAFGAVGVILWLSQRDLVLRPLPAFVILAIPVVVITARPLVVAYKNQGFQFSLESSLVLALMTIFGVLPAVLVQAIASVTSDVVRRKGWAKTLFNASQLVLATAAAGGVLEAALGRELAPPGMSFSAAEFPPLLLALGTFLLVNITFTALILWLAGGWSFSAVIRDFVLSEGSVIEVAALLLVAPISVTVQLNPFLALFMLAPIAALYRATKVALENVKLLEEQRFALEQKHAAEEAARQEEAARAAAERANHAKSDFLSHMSHELRTPLNAILGFAQLLDMDPLAPEQKQSTAEIINAGKHLLELINEVLDISRIEAGRLQLSLEPVDAVEVIAECVSMLSPLADRDGITLAVEREGISNQLILITADRQRLKQVVLNLISNAIKYNREHGSVRVFFEASERGRGLRIHVADTGPGIAPERMERLFAPFERLGAEGSPIEGTGLGLALSKLLVESMGGTISVASGVGRGSIFTVELPLEDASAWTSGGAVAGRSRV